MPFDIVDLHVFHLHLFNCLIAFFNPILLPLINLQLRFIVFLYKLDLGFSSYKKTLSNVVLMSYFVEKKNNSLIFYRKIEMKGTKIDTEEKIEGSFFDSIVCVSFFLKNLCFRFLEKYYFHLLSLKIIYFNINIHFIYI